MPRPAKALVLAALLAAVPAPAAAAATPLARTLAKAMRGAGGASGAQVVNATTGTRVFSLRAGRRRILASNTKLFTSSTALVRFGVAGTLGTEVRGRGSLTGDGVFDGDLFLRGGGDPTFGTRRFEARAYGGGPATVETLATRLKEAGIKRVNGRVFGDESRFDSRRGTPASHWRLSAEVGPLSALSFNRGLTRGGFGFQGNPPLFAASRLTRALKARGVKVRRPPGVGRAPVGAEVLASVDSPPMTRLIRIMNKPSDNYFAEMLLKDVGLQAFGRGTTRGGARAARGFARRLGARVRLSDGSGLSRADRASPAAIVRLLLAMQKRQVEFPAFYASLPVAGRDGTLVHRMRRGPARRRCHAKTGTLSNVSALSGYCQARSGEIYVFSFLMNRVNPYGARAIQDRMAQAIAGVRSVSSPGAPAAAPRR